MDHASGTSSVYHDARPETQAWCVRLAPGADLAERACAFVAERLADAPGGEQAAQIIQEIARDLVPLGLYPEYEVGVCLARDTVYCSFEGVPVDDAEEPPELDRHTANGHWPGTGPGRLLSLRGHEIDNGTELELPRPAP